MIVLSSKADEGVRNDMFDRINTNSLDLAPMETRKSVYRSNFIDFIFECTKNKIFVELCPIYKYFQNRDEEAELILRFFAFSETYPAFCLQHGENSTDLEQTSVAKFLDEYIIWKNKNFTNEEQKLLLRDFEIMLNFVKKTFPSGFKKFHDSDVTSRPYFEAISVGSHLALQEKPELVVRGLWKSSEKDNQVSLLFRIPIGRYYTHKPDNIRERIDYVKKMLLSHS